MKKSILDDLYRYLGKRDIKSFLRMFFFTPGFRYIVYYRKAGSTSYPIKFFYKFLMRRCGLKFGFQIPEYTEIGPGFRIVHYGTIIINPASNIGKNLNIYPGVTIGHSNGRNFGSPVIGNNVSISTNATIIGSVKIGNDVLIAPGAFVNFDVPNGSLVLGNPGQIIIKEKASATEYVFPLA